MSFNKSILFSVILLTLSCSKKREPAFTWLYGYGQVEKINGRVKTLTEEKFADNKMIPYFLYYFDDKGNVTKIENIFKKGIDTTVYSTVYGNNGKKIESIGLYLDSGRKIKEIYKFDNNERMTGYINNANALTTDTDRFFYDGVGNLVEQQQYFKKKPLWTFRFKYNYNKGDTCIGIEQSTTTWRDNFKTTSKDTTKYVDFDTKKIG